MSPIAFNNERARERRGIFGKGPKRTMLLKCFEAADCQTLCSSCLCSQGGSMLGLSVPH